MNHVDESGPDARTLIRSVRRDVLDVLGLNEYLGWYWGRPEDADKLQWKVTLNKPLIVSEFGGGAVYGRHGDTDERWTEEYQENLFRAPVGDGGADAESGGADAVGADGFPVSDAHASRSAGLSQSQRADFESRRDASCAFYVLQDFYEESGGGEVSRFECSPRKILPFAEQRLQSG